MVLHKASTGTVIALAITGLFLTLAASGVLTASKTVPTSGTLTAVNVAIFNDSGCTQNCASIDWGTVSPGNAVTKTIYIKNLGTIPVTLSMNNGSWVPTNANSYLTVTWNRGNYALNPGASISAALTLKASSSTSGITSFSFNIIITGTQ